MQLIDLKAGRQVRVVKLHQGDKLYRQKLVAQGVMPGAVLTMVRVAPLGDPIEIMVRGTHLCLRKAEATIIQIEEM